MSKKPIDSTRDAVTAFVLISTALNRLWEIRDNSEAVIEFVNMMQGQYGAGKDERIWIEWSQQTLELLADSFGEED